MLQLELSGKMLLLGLGGLCLFIILLIIGAHWYLRKKTITNADQPLWSKVKNLAFDPLRQHTAFSRSG